MNLQHKLSQDIAKWKLDESKLSKEDKEVLEIINFPKQLGYRQAAQMVIDRVQANNGFIDKHVITINDIKFKVTNKETANWWVGMHSLPAGANDVQKDHLNGVMKSKSKKFVFVDGNYMDDLLQTMLDLFSTPKATPSMIADKPKAEKKKVSRKYVLSDEEKENIKDMANNQSMDVKEISEALGAPMTVIKEYLKTLNNG